MWGLRRRRLLRTSRTCVEINAPEVRRGSQELHTDAIAAVATFAEEHNTALLFFLSLGIDQYEHLAVVDFVAEIQETTMGANHESLASLAKLPTLMAAPEGLQTHLVKDALAPTGTGL